MRALATVLASAALLASCGGAVEDAPPSVTVTRASLVDDGAYFVATIEARVTGGAQGGRVALWAAAAYDARPLAPAYDSPACEAYAGWLLDGEALPELELAPNESRDLTLRATSDRAPSCAPRSIVARCGEPITVVLVPEGEGTKGGGFSTQVRCELDAFALRR